MSEFAKKYHKAYDAERRFRDAPRRGWADPRGKKNAGNQTIEVRREEAVDLAAGLASALYSSYCWLYESLALRNYMDQIAEGDSVAVECPKCHVRYVPDWMGGKCPYCAAEAGATEKVRKMREEAEKGRPEAGRRGWEAD